MKDSLGRLFAWLSLLSMANVPLAHATIDLREFRKMGRGLNRIISYMPDSQAFYTFWPKSEEYDKVWEGLDDPIPAGNGIYFLLDGTWQAGTILGHRYNQIIVQSSLSGETHEVNPVYAAATVPAINGKHINQNVFIAGGVTGVIVAFPLYPEPSWSRTALVKLKNGRIVVESTVNIGIDPRIGQPLNSQPNAAQEAEQCSVCMNEPKNIALSPCGHVTVGTQCAEQIRSCPICRSNITSRLRIYQ